MVFGQKGTMVVIEAELYYYLENFFTEKQLNIIFKRYNGLLLTKTETETFSRTIKKKLLTLSDPNVTKVAQQVIQEIL